MPVAGGYRLAVDAADVHVEASLGCFRQAGDHRGQAATLPMRAQLRRYDDLDGALADLREARTLAVEFGALSLGDQLYSDLRWIDLHLRRGDTDRATAMIDSARERALHASSAEMLILVDAREAGLRVRLGDLDRAADLLDDAERGLRGGTAFPADHARTLVGSARAALCLALGDLPGADKALREACTAALATRNSLSCRWWPCTRPRSPRRAGGSTSRPRCSAPPPACAARTTTPIHRSASSPAAVRPRWAGKRSPRRTRKAGSWTQGRP